MNNLFSTLLNVVKAKLVPVWTKLKLFCHASYLKTQVFNKIRSFFSSMLNVKPRNKNDYYPFLLWLVSKRLALAVVMVLGILGAYYIFCVNPPAAFLAGEDGIRTYDYDALPLRFISGKVRIKAKSGYIAYEGEVEKGRAKGQGILYDSEQNIVYTGMFENSMYNGRGKLFYAGGQLRYEGEFTDNEYEGEGKLYRQNGTLEYDGVFLNGNKSGSGTLYDSGSNMIYNGTFSNDSILYSELLGKSTADVASIYMGERTAYYDDTAFAAALKDIGVLYQTEQKDTLKEESTVQKVFVWENSVPIGEKRYTRVTELEAYMGQPVYEGNTYITMPEAVCLEYLQQKGITLLDTAGLEKKSLYDDVVQIEDYEKDYMLYLYTYEYEGLLYTFYCKSRYGEFAMYSIERAETR